MAVGFNQKAKKKLNKIWPFVWPCRLLANSQLGSCACATKRKLSDQTTTPTPPGACDYRTCLPTSLFLTRALRTCANSYPQIWLLCHMGEYWFKFAPQVAAPAQPSLYPIRYQRKKNLLVSPWLDPGRTSRSDALRTQAAPGSHPVRIRFLSSSHPGRIQVVPRT